ncbi:MAG: hypothetical protein K0R27_1337 [Xanthobacteraceae bacterium]|nr:hypothetical protein [Xanthobacteraceae bacterium]
MPFTSDDRADLKRSPPERSSCSAVSSEATAILARALREDVIPGASFDFRVDGDAIVTRHPNERNGEYCAQHAIDPLTGSPAAYG